MNFFFHYSSFSIDQMINNLTKYQISKRHVKHKFFVVIKFNYTLYPKYIIYTRKGVEYDTKKRYFFNFFVWCTDFFSFTKLSLAETSDSVQLSNKDSDLTELEKVVVTEQNPPEKSFLISTYLQFKPLGNLLFSVQVIAY
jgi:hypothetical protein